MTTCYAIISKATGVVVVLMLALGTPKPGIAQFFTNVAPLQGIDIQVFGDDFGSGMSCLDFDNDGWDDLTYAMRNDSLVFYRNINGQLERQPSYVMAEGQTKHVLWCDFDNDGDNDLMVTTWLGTYRLYRNEGDLTFTHVSAQSGLAQDAAFHNGASFGDYDRDGDLDLYICNYQYEGDENDPTLLNHLYRNNGDGTFTDVTLEAGVGNGLRMSFQAVWIDHDRDGWQDLYVINDRWFANTMYHNNGDGTFTDVTEATGSAVEGHDVMTATVGDFDNDGDLDIYMTNTGFFDHRGLLLVDQGDGTYQERAAQYGVDIDKWSWGAVWVDFDNDTYQDLYIATSLPNFTVEDNLFFRNVQGMGFSDGASAFQGDHNARSFAVGRLDIDNNGAYDIATQNQSPYAPFLWLNSGGPNNHIKITLQGTTSNRMAIGSWIRVYAGGNCYTQYTMCGENYLGQNSQHHIFGLGAFELVDSVQVEYLSGHIDTYFQLPAGQAYQFVEGDTYAASITPLGATAFCTGGQVVLDAGEHDAYLWNTGHQERFLTVTTPGAYWVVTQNSFGVQATSDTVQVTIHPQPQVSIDVTHPLCAEEASGSISLVNLAGVPPQEVNWNSGASGASISNLPEGAYDFEFIDINGCTSTGTADLIAPPPLDILVNTAPEVLGNDGSIQLVIFGGTPPHEIELDGSPASNLIDGLPAGTYELIVTDANGCTLALTVVIDDLTSISEIRTSGLQIFPNPTSDQLTLVGSTSFRSICILDASGRIVQLLHPADASTLDVTDLAPGSYVLQAIDRQGNKLCGPFLKVDR